jgi:hypothetical protein
MIDQTSLMIEETRETIRQNNVRRYAFYTMLHTTDRILWRLEEMNRDGMKTLSAKARSQIREQLEELPQEIVNLYQDSSETQVVLDSIFDMQEALFKWRDPQATGDEEDLERLAG